MNELEDFSEVFDVPRDIENNHVWLNYDLESYNHAPNFSDRMKMVWDLYSENPEIWKLIFDSKDKKGYITTITELEQDELDLEREVPQDLLEITNFVDTFEALHREKEGGKIDESEFLSVAKRLVAELRALILLKTDDPEILKIHNFFVNGFLRNDIRYLSPDLIEKHQRSREWAERIRRSFATFISKQVNFIAVVPNLISKKNTLARFYSGISHERVHLHFRKKPDSLDGYGSLDKNQRLLFEELFACMEDERVMSLMVKDRESLSSMKRFIKENKDIIELTGKFGIPPEVVYVVWYSYHHTVDQLENMKYSIKKEK